MLSYLDKRFFCAFGVNTLILTVPTSVHAWLLDFFLFAVTFTCLFYKLFTFTYLSTILPVLFSLYLLFTKL